MRVWAVCVVAFFGAVELYQWVQGLTLPLPIYGVAGLLLAIASNADRLRWLQSSPSALTTQQSAYSEPLQVHQDTEPPIERPSPSSRVGPQLPSFPKGASPPISFTIRSSRSRPED